MTGALDHVSFVLDAVATSTRVGLSYLSGVVASHYIMRLT